MEPVDIVKLIVAFLLPPLAVYMEAGIGTDFWINVILTLLFWIPGILHALCESPRCMVYLKAAILSRAGILARLPKAQLTPCFDCTPCFEP